MVVEVGVGGSDEVCWNGAAEENSYHPILSGAGCSFIPSYFLKCIGHIGENEKKKETY